MLTVQPNLEPTPMAYRCQCNVRVLNPSWWSHTDCWHWCWHWLLALMCIDVGAVRSISQNSPSRKHSGITNTACYPRSNIRTSLPWCQQVTIVTSINHITLGVMHMHHSFDLGCVWVTTVQRLLLWLRWLPCCIHWPVVGPLCQQSFCHIHVCDVTLVHLLDGGQAFSFFVLRTVTKH